MLCVLLDIAVGELTADETLGVKHGVRWVRRRLVLCGFTDEAFVVGEGDPRRSDTVTLVVGDDFNLAAALDAELLGAGRQRGATYATALYVVPRSILYHERACRMDGRQRRKDKHTGQQSSSCQRIARTR